MNKISICIPTYKRPDILADTLSHLASIRNIDMEVIVSDNFSQDKTPDVVKTFEGKFGSLRYHCQCDNLGGIVNMQTALSMASGEFVYLLSDDDQIVPEGIQSAIGMMDKNPEIVAIYGSYQEWEPKTDRILLERIIVNEPQLYDTSDKLKILNQFPLLWLPVMRTDIYQRFSFYDCDNNDIWTLVGMLMKYGKIAVIPDIFYKHAHTEPRMEYELTEPWYHDTYRATYEKFYAGMEEDMSDPKKALEFMQFVGSRTVHAYLQGYRFACIKGEYLKQRHYLLRARAYGLVNSEQLLDWEKGSLASASAERFKKIFSNLPDVRAIVIENTDVLRSFMVVMGRMFSDIPKAIEVSRDEFIVRNNGTGEFLLSENYETLACRNKANSQVNRGFQYALYDLFSNLRITNAPLNINI